MSPNTPSLEQIARQGNMNRRNFLKLASILGGTTILNACSNGDSGRGITNPPNGDNGNQNEKVTLRAGQLQDNQTNTGQPGKIRIYDASKQLLEEVQTSPTGEYQPVELPLKSGYFIQGGIVKNDNLESFVRSININEGIEDGATIGPETIRAVPTDDLDAIGVTKEIFKAYTETTFEDSITRYDFENGFEKVFIERVNPATDADDNPIGTFTEQEQNLLAQTLEMEDGVPRYLQGRKLPVTLGDGTQSSRPYTIKDEDTIEIREGHIVVLPDNTLTSENGETKRGFGGSFDNPSDGLYDNGIVFLNFPVGLFDSKKQELMMHEMGHALGWREHPDEVVEWDESNMTNNRQHGRAPKPTSLDEKGGYLLMEETYQPQETISESILLEDFF